MRILYLSFYYRPDLSAGSFRNTALVNELARQLPAGSQVDVITTVPNRYASFTTNAPAEESTGCVRIRRVALPGHDSGMTDQSRAFWAYARAAIRLSRHSSYDLVFASSSRLLTAALAAHIARRKRTSLYLDIRDIFVDTIKDVLSRKVALVLQPAFSALEKRTMRRAQRVNLVSEGFRSYFEKRYPDTRLSVFTNGIDDEFIREQPTGITPAARVPVSILYAGNMGEGQGLHHVVPELANRLRGRASFALIGGGGRLERLRSAIATAGCDNVTIAPPVDRDALIEAYQAADVLFLHLNDYAAFRKVLPSKLFEYAALGKPILAGVGGYAAQFVEAHISNAAVFAPCDVDAGVRAFDALELVTKPRPSFVQKFARNHIMQAMAADVIAVAQEH